MGWLFLSVICLFLIVITIIILVYGFVTKKKNAFHSLMLLWGTIFLFGLLTYVIGLVKRKKILKKEDFYGQYIIDRDFFSGKQSDWQYDNFRFEIKENDSIYFYITDKEKINKTYKGKISTLAPYKSARLVINMEEPNHHILTTNPTIYRRSWDFFMVFNSPEFSNMYFKKGEWEQIE